MRHGSPLTRWAFLALPVLVGSSFSQGLLPASFVEPGITVEDDLANLSLEELMSVEVTIASRDEQELSEVAAAVYVVTGEEIRAAGHASVQEALRMVPGFYVSRWTDNAWDVTSRGFGTGLSNLNLAYLNQLLVLVDGVSQFSPLFAGVWWSALDLDVADIERIEVIRGPGGILWGTNAVHGVVNIVTKDSAKTLGPRVTIQHGTNDQHLGVRYGGRLGERTTFNVWTKGANYEQFDEVGVPGYDFGWTSVSAGARLDHEDDEGRHYRLSTRLHDVEIGWFDTAFVPDDQRFKGFQIEGSLRDPDKGSELTVWLDLDEKLEPFTFRSQVWTFDVNYQRQFSFAENHGLTLGGGYRKVWSELVGLDTTFLEFSPEELALDTFRAYALETWRFPEAKAELTVGATVEHNDFTQFEVQPTIRGTWKPTEKVLLWAALSRAVRTPSIEERTSSGPLYRPTEFQSEQLHAFELGVRSQLSSSLAVDLALFRNDYVDLQFEQFDGTSFYYTNAAEGEAWGVELAIDAKPTERLTVRSAASLLDGSHEAFGVDLETDDYHPELLLNTRLYYDLGHDVSLTAAGYAVESLGEGFEGGEYFRFDARLAWNPNENLELFVGGQNIGDPRHSELGDTQYIPHAFLFGMNWTPGEAQ